MTHMVKANTAGLRLLEVASDTLGTTAEARVTVFKDLRATSSRGLQAPITGITGEVTVVSEVGEEGVGAHLHRDLHHRLLCCSCCGPNRASCYGGDGLICSSRGGCRQSPSFGNGQHSGDQHCGY